MSWGVCVRRACNAWTAHELRVIAIQWQCAQLAPPCAPSSLTCGANAPRPPVALHMPAWWRVRTLPSTPAQYTCLVHLPSATDPQCTCLPAMPCLTCSPVCMSATPVQQLRSIAEGGDTGGKGGVSFAPEKAKHHLLVGVDHRHPRPSRKTAPTSDSWQHA